MNDGFQQCPRPYPFRTADSEASKGRLFERLMKAYFMQRPALSRTGSLKVWLWADWAIHAHTGFDGTDTGIDLVADGARWRLLCAIQCKCYMRLHDSDFKKAHLDSFIAASTREPFTTLLVVDTGAEWGPNARKLVEKLSRSLHSLYVSTTSQTGL